MALCIRAWSLCNMGRFINSREWPRPWVSVDSCFTKQEEAASAQRQHKAGKGEGAWLISCLRNCRDFSRGQCQRGRIDLTLVSANEARHVGKCLWQPESKVLSDGLKMPPTSSAPHVFILKSAHSRQTNVIQKGKAVGELLETKFAFQMELSLAIRPTRWQIYKRHSNAEKEWWKPWYTYSW